MTNKADLIWQLYSLKVLFDFNGESYTCFLDTIVCFIDISAADVYPGFEPGLKTEFELDEIVSMGLVAMNHEDNMLMALRDLLAGLMIACFVDFFEDLEGVLKVGEEVEILDGEGIAPILLIALVAFSHEGYLF